MTPAGRLGAFITKVKRGSIADVVGQLKSGTCLRHPPSPLASRAVSVLDSGAEGPGFKSQPRRCRVTVVGRLFIPIVPLFTKQ